MRTEQTQPGWGSPPVPSLFVLEQLVPITTICMWPQALRGDIGRALSELTWWQVAPQRQQQISRMGHMGQP